VSVTNPQRIRIENRRKEQAKWRSHKRWKQLVIDHARVPGALCVHCLKKHGDIRKNGKPVVLTINHIGRALYNSEEEYCTWDPNEMEICCTTCNWKIETGQKPCPVCHTVYIHWRDYTCPACWDKAHPVEAEKRALVAYRKRVLWGLKKVLAREAQSVMRKQLSRKFPHKNKKRAN
jgi:hypothetical protein